MVAELAPILTALYGFYNILFRPLLASSPYIAMGFFSLCLAGMFSLIYWYMLDIEKADKIKEKMKHHQDKMKEARSNDENEKASEHMQKSMEMNQKLMVENFKPMIGTLLFVALVFPWLGATFAPGVAMDPVDNNTWSGELNWAGQQAEITVTNSSGNVTANYQNQTTSVQNGRMKIFGINWETANFREHNGGIFAAPKGHVLKLGIVFVELPFSLPFAGNTLNWLGFYILLAMPLTYIFRKALGVA